MEPEAPGLLGTSVGQVPMDRLRGIFEGMFDGVWFVGPDGRTTYANGAMAGLLASTPTEMRDRSIHEYVDEAIWPLIDAFLGRQRSVTGERIEVTLRRSDGGELLGLIAGSPITTVEGVVRRDDAERQRRDRQAGLRRAAGADAAARGDRRVRRGDRARLQQPPDRDPGPCRAALEPTCPKTTRRGPTSTR